MTSATLKDPIVSVIIGCYNHENYVIEALNSAKNQTYKNIEIIIWDDASTDQSVEKIKHWIIQNKIECHFIINQKNRGLCASLNTAIRKSKGEYISFFSADDQILPFKIEKQVSTLRNLGPEYCLVYSKACSVDANGNDINKIVGVDCSAIDIFDSLFNVTFALPTMTVLMRKECIENVGYYDEEIAMEDIDMWIRLVKKYKFFFIDETTAVNRELGTSLSRNPGNFKRIGNSIRATRIKCLENKWLNPTQTTTAMRDLDHLIWNSYKNGQNIDSKKIKLFFLHSQMRYAKTIAVFIVMGIPFQVFITVKEFIYNRLKLIRP